MYPQIEKKLSKNMDLNPYLIFSDIQLKGKISGVYAAVKSLQNSSYSHDCFC